MILLAAGSVVLYWIYKKWAVITCGVSVGLIIGFMFVCTLQNLIQHTLNDYLCIAIVLIFGVKCGLMMYVNAELFTIFFYSIAGSYMFVSGIGMLLGQFPMNENTENIGINWVFL